MATLYAYKGGGLIRRAHEWAAGHFRFIQYPRPQLRRMVARPDWTTTALKWMAFGVGMWLIWGGFALIAVCVLIAIAS
jgi:hypothetical protein